MALTNFNGDTFVAFMDISGFKMMMTQKRRAVDALDKLYRAGYNALQRHPDVQGLFISDSGILVGYEEEDKVKCLISLLRAIREINQDMLEANIMLTTSIAYGQFSYHQRIEFPGIEKNPVYGNGYVSAYLDNENGKPKIQPGQCRISTSNLPFDKEDIINSQNDLFGLVYPKQNDNNHLYFYWMVQDSCDIDGFEQHYSDAYNLKFRGMLDALRGHRY